MQYVDSSAWAKLYVREPTSERARAILGADSVWVTAAHTQVEVRRVIGMRLRGRTRAEAQREFLDDWSRVDVVALDRATCGLAAEIAETSSLRTLDAMHLAAAQRAEIDGPFVTFDVRQAEAARRLGFTVVGA